MESYGLDNAPLIALGAFLFLALCMALGRSRRATAKQPNIEAELLTQIRDGLAENNASLGQLKDAVQHQQAAFERIATTLESMRQSADDHASDLKGGIERVSGAIDAGRAEATTRHETMNEAIDAVRRTATDAQENAHNANLTVNGLRRKIHEIDGHVGGIPELRRGIEQVQQDVAAITAKADHIQTLGAEIENLQENVSAIAEATVKKRQARKTGGGRDKNKSNAKADPEGTAASAAGPPDDAGKPADTAPQSGATPRRTPRKRGARAADSNKPSKPASGADGDAPSRQQTEPGSGTAEPSNEKPHDAAGAAGNDTPAQTGDKTGEAPPAGPGATGAEQQAAR